MFPMVSVKPRGSKPKSPTKVPSRPAGLSRKGRAIVGRVGRVGIVYIARIVCV